MDSDFHLLIIAKQHYMLNPNLHSIAQVLFKRGDSKNIFNQTDLTTNVSEADTLAAYAVVNFLMTTIILNINYVIVQK